MHFLQIFLFPKCIILYIASLPPAAFLYTIEFHTHSPRVNSNADLPARLADPKNITVVPFYVSFDDGHYLKENVEIGIRDFYQKMVDRKGIYPKSSMPSIHDYEEAFLPFAVAGPPVICICITTKSSGSMQSALNARWLVLEAYPQGESFPSGMDRGRKRTARKALDLLLESLQESSLGIESYSLAVGYGYDREEGKNFRDHTLAVLQEKSYGIEELPVYQIGAAIGVHTGPFPLGFGIIEKGLHP